MDWGRSRKTNGKDKPQKILKMLTILFWPTSNLIIQLDSDQKEGLVQAVWGFRASKQADWITIPQIILPGVTERTKSWSRICTLKFCLSREDSRRKELIRPHRKSMITILIKNTLAFQYLPIPSHSLYMKIIRDCIINKW